MPADIKHIVVLMLENRSFDHFLGTMPGVDGVVDKDGKVKPALVNYADPKDPSSTAFHPKEAKLFFTPVNQRTGKGGEYGGPSHSFPSATVQRFGVKTVGNGKDETTPYYDLKAAPKTTPADNSGFVKDFIDELTNINREFAHENSAIEEVMEYYTKEQLPAIHELASEFCVCDRWFSEVPGPTEPNRLFMHAATSTGLTYNPWALDTLGVPTIYKAIESKKKTWAMYGFDLWDSSNFKDIEDAPQGKLSFEDFQKAAHDGNLPYYSFICPRYSDANEAPANSQHAPHDVRYGDVLIADVYKAVRNGKGWNDTLLAVVYDEHGGYYDHVTPVPREAPVPLDMPDENVSSPNAFMQKEAKRIPKNPEHSKKYLIDPDYSYDFKTSGFRVPAILVSPWIEKGKVDRTHYGHTSVLKYIEDQIGAEPLTNRDKNAKGFADVLSLDKARTDCPTELKVPWTPEYDPELQMKKPPSPKQDEWVRRYTVSLKGHRDTGKLNERDFPTNADLNRYIAERNRAHKWYHNDDWKAARFEVYADSDRRWHWRLRDSDGSELAASANHYDTREEAQTALERIRFLSNVLNDPTLGE